MQITWHGKVRDVVVSRSILLTPQTTPLSTLLSLVLVGENGGERHARKILYAQGQSPVQSLGLGLSALLWHRKAHGNRLGTAGCQ